METTTNKLALAALLGNIGFFIHETKAAVSPDEKTAFFIQKHKTNLPENLFGEQQNDVESLADLVKGLTAPQSPFQKILHLARSAALGNPLGDLTGTSKISGQERLTPIFEKVCNPRAENEYNYPLSKVSNKNIFPVKNGKTFSEQGIEKLLQSFEQALAGMGADNGIRKQWFEHFNDLMAECFSLVPLPLAVEGGDRGKDIPVYDHARTWAAMASALYQYHFIEEPEYKTLKELKTKKILVINGNFYGIQKFIFGGHGESRKLRSKILRGRSFYVSLLSELASNMILKRFKLPISSVLINAAGKFTILAPNTADAREKLAAIEDVINDWLVNITFGETVFGIAATEASLEDFSSAGMPDLLDRMEADSQDKKYTYLDLRNYATSQDQYLDGFKNNFSPVVCPVCDRRPSELSPEEAAGINLEKPVCRLCRDFIFIGANLVRSQTQLPPENHLKVHIFTDNKGNDGYDLRFKDNAVQILWNGIPVKHWTIEDHEEGSAARPVRHLGGYVPNLDDDDPDAILKLQDLPDEDDLIKERDGVGRIPSFNYIAAMARHIKNGKACGTAALGVMKADVDNLGRIMGCGIEQGINLARWSAFSRQMNDFLTIFLPVFLKKNCRYAYTVFAGGDDLFVIGPWNDIIEISGSLNDEFRRYCCYNPELHLSAGIITCKPGAAVDTIARQAEAALKQAKKEDKDRFNIFGVTRKWPELQELKTISEYLGDKVDSNTFKHAMLYRLNRLIPMVAAEHALGTREAIHIRDMDCTRWRYLLAYTLDRNLPLDCAVESKAEITSTLTAWLNKHRSAFKIPLWKVLYNFR